MVIQTVTGMKSISPSDSDDTIDNTVGSTDSYNHRKGTIDDTVKSNDSYKVGQSSTKITNIGY